MSSNRKRRIIACGLVTRYGPQTNCQRERSNDKRKPIRCVALNYAIVRSGTFSPMPVASVSHPSLSCPIHPLNLATSNTNTPVRISYAAGPRIQTTRLEPASQPAAASLWPAPFSRRRGEKLERGGRLRESGSVAPEPEGWKGRMDAFRLGRTFPPAPLCLCSTEIMDFRRCTLAPLSPTPFYARGFPGTGIAEG